MSESLGHRKKDWDFSSTLKTLLDRHTLELSNEELEEINLYLLNQREHAIALYSQQLYGMKRTAKSFIQHFNILSGSVTTHELKKKEGFLCHKKLKNNFEERKKDWDLTGLLGDVIRRYIYQLTNDELNEIKLGKSFWNARMKRFKNGIKLPLATMQQRRETWGSQSKLDCTRAYDFLYCKVQ